jgi:hypothetical protein
VFRDQAERVAPFECNAHAPSVSREAMKNGEDLESVAGIVLTCNFCGHALTDEYLEVDLSTSQDSPLQFCTCNCVAAHAVIQSHEVDDRLRVQIAELKERAAEDVITIAHLRAGLYT